MYISVESDKSSIHPALYLSCLPCTVFIPVPVIPAQGIRDLFWLPVEQYKKDGRLVRGIQRGATSFSTSTAMAMLELTNRAVQSVQVRISRFFFGVEVFQVEGKFWVV